MPQSSKHNIIAGQFVANDDETITISTKIKKLTLSKINKEPNFPAKKALITCESGNIRYKYSGNNPSSTQGHFMFADDFINVYGTQNIKNFRAIRTGDDDAVLSITYEI